MLMKALYMFISMRIPFVLLSTQVYLRNVSSL